MLPFPFLIEEGKMKLGELKLEALMMITPLAELDADADGSTALADRIRELRENSNYSDYIVAMPGAFNRCFTSLESKGLVPLKTRKVDTGELTRRGTSLCFDTSKIKDLCKIVGVYYYSDYTSPCRCDYSHLGSEILIRDFKDGTFVIEYMPRIERITNISGDDSTEIQLDEDVCALIPYFIKSELLRIENEQEAAVARNIYEQMADEIQDKRTGHQGTVESVYEVEI